MQKMAKRIKQIGMVVADIEKAIEHWRSLGAGEFRRFFLSSSRNTCFNKNPNIFIICKIHYSVLLTKFLRRKLI